MKARLPKNVNGFLFYSVFSLNDQEHEMNEQDLFSQDEDRDTHVREMLELSLMHAGRGINS